MGIKLSREEQIQVKLDHAHLQESLKRAVSSSLHIMSMVDFDDDLECEYLPDQLNDPDRRGNGDE